MSTDSAASLFRMKKASSTRTFDSPLAGRSIDHDSGREIGDNPDAARKF